MPSQRPNEHHLTFKTDTATLDKMAKAYEELAEANREMQLEQKRAMNRVLHGEK